MMVLLLLLYSSCLLPTYNNCSSIIRRTINRSFFFFFFFRTAPRNNIFLDNSSTCPVIIRKIRGNGRRKYKERRGFPDFVKEEVLRKQNNRCTHCHRILNVVNSGHKDDNRSKKQRIKLSSIMP